MGHPLHMWFRCRAVAFTLAAALGVARHASAQAPGAQRGAIDGHVTALNGTVRLPGARIDVRDVTNQEVALLRSEGDGHFRVEGLADGTYRIVVALEGFASAAATATVAGGRSPDLSIDLTIAALSDTIDVVASAAIVSSSETLSPSETIDSTAADRLAPGGGLSAALRLLASVIEVPGGVSIRGGRPTQASVQIGASTLVEPSMGLVRLTLPDDAIDSVSVLPNPYAVEYGRFSSGLVVIQTRRAGDQWKIRVNSLDPTFRTKRHQELWNIQGISGFGPRVEAGGPIVPGHLWLEQTAQYRYSTDDLPSRPENERRTAQWLSSFSRVDASLSLRHSLIGMVGLFPSVTTMASLGTFVPPEATVDVRQRGTHAAATERALWSDRLVGESTLQWRRSRIGVDGQGTAPMELWPDTTTGNFFNTQLRAASTFQWVETISGSATGGATGLHLFKAGVDVLRTSYDGTSASRPVLIRRANGTLSRRLDFRGETTQSVESSDVAFFAQDRMQPTPRWFIEYGARLDRDGIVEHWNLTPRVGTAVLLNEAGTSVVRGGYGLFYERTPSAAGAFEQFETFADSRFGADGLTPIGARVPFAHEIEGDLATARSRTWDLSYDYRWTTRWSLHAGLLDRRGARELIVDTIQRDGAGALVLQSEGRSQYRDVEIGLHYAPSSAADLNLSYTHATADSDLNAFATYFDAMLSPIVQPNQYALSSAHVPHRLFARGYLLPTPRWLLVGVLDWRTGLPYSIVNDALDPVGPRNSARMPNVFRLDLGIEHRFHIAKWRPWIGVRAYNALNSFNPTDVQANTGSPAFGGFYNSDYRQLRLQLRFER